jgi:hypothetical protein
MTSKGKNESFNEFTLEQLYIAWNNGLCPILNIEFNPLLSFRLGIIKSELQCIIEQIEITKRDIDDKEELLNFLQTKYDFIPKYKIKLEEFENYELTVSQMDALSIFIDTKDEEYDIDDIDDENITLTYKETYNLWDHGLSHILNKKFAASVAYKLALVKTNITPVINEIITTNKELILKHSIDNDNINKEEYNQDLNEYLKKTYKISGNCRILIEDFKNMKMNINQMSALAKLIKF